MGSRYMVEPGNQDENKVNWLDLPSDALSVIADKLIIKDQILLGSSCRQWQFVYNELRRSHALQRPLPVLLFPTEDEDEDHDTTCTHTCSLYSLTDNKLCDFRLPVPRRYWPGCSFGWLVTVTVASADQDAQVTLLNPFFNDKEINLPPLSAFQLAPRDDGIWNHYFFQRAVVSADPASNPNNCIVMAIYGQFARLAFCRPGDKAWTTLSSDVINMEDIIYYKDQFYAINADEGDLWECDLVNLKLSKVAPGPGFACKRYLVESASTGELLQILRHRFMQEEHDDEGNNIEIDNPVYYTKSFDVFKLHFDKGEWIKMDDHLQGCTLFIGDNSSFSLFASDYKNPLGCQPNTIYFTDDYHDGHQDLDKVPEDTQLDMGVFHFKDRYTRPHYSNRCTKYVPAPIWIGMPRPSCKGPSRNL